MQVANPTTTNKPKPAIGICAFCGSKKSIVLSTTLAGSEGSICVHCLHKATQLADFIEPGEIRCYSCKNTKRFRLIYNNGVVVEIIKGAMLDGEVTYPVNSTKGVWDRDMSPVSYMCGNPKCKKPVPYWMFKDNKHVKSSIPGASK